MEFGDAISLGREFFMTALMLSAPVVVVSLVVGLFISVAQTVTSIQEQTLSFAPRIVAVVGLLIWTASWYLGVLQDYTLNVMTRMVELAR